MKANFTPSFDEERHFWNKDIPHVIGIDEVGRGCFAGPVVVAGVIFKPSYFDHFLNNQREFAWLQEVHDSKLVTKKVREKLSPLIHAHALHCAISEISVPLINAYGIGKATFLGMQEVVTTLQKKIAEINIAVLVDAFTIPGITLPQRPIIKGDQKSISIAAASIIAKVYRDARMQEVGKAYPAYAFEKNKGYGTKMHREAIAGHGLCDMHRTSFDLSKYIK